MKMSRRALRMEKHHKRKRSVLGINLVSLMDIFTILVFFLLVNSSEVEVLPSAKTIQLPESLAAEKPRETLVVMVTEDEIRRKCKRNLMAAYRKAGIQVAHNPVADLTAPKVRQLEEIVEAAAEWLHTERIAVHCNAGVGRTGVVVGCLAARMLHLRGEQALDFVHQHMHVNLTNEQKRFISDWADKRFHG